LRGSPSRLSQQRALLSQLCTTITLGGSVGVAGGTSLIRTAEALFA
jgi:hypothetical protein